MTEARQEPQQEEEAKEPEQEADEARRGLVEILQRRLKDKELEKLPPGPVDSSQVKADPESLAESEPAHETSHSTADSEEAAADDKGERFAAEPAAGSDEWLRKEKPIKGIDAAITAEKKELKATPLSAQSGRYKYKPRLVKSLFSDEGNK